LKYSIDTSAILDAWRRRYPPDVFPAVWVRFDEAIDAGDLGASEEVLLEVEKRDDEVHEWAKARKAKTFVPIDEEQQRHVASILGKHERLVDTRKNRSAADPFVIALAMAQGDRGGGDWQGGQAEHPGRLLGGGRSLDDSAGAFPRAGLALLNLGAAWGRQAARLRRRHPARRMTAPAGAAGRPAGAAAKPQARIPGRRGT